MYDWLDSQCVFGEIVCLHLVSSIAQPVIRTSLPTFDTPILAQLIRNNDERLLRILAVLLVARSINDLIWHFEAIPEVLVLIDAQERRDDGIRI